MGTQTRTQVKLGPNDFQSNQVQADNTKKTKQKNLNVLHRIVPGNWEKVAGVQFENVCCIAVSHFVMLLCLIFFSSFSSPYLLFYFLFLITRATVLIEAFSFFSPSASDPAPLSLRVSSCINTSSGILSLSLHSPERGGEGRGTSPSEVALSLGDPCRRRTPSAGLSDRRQKPLR